jgi:hypothetical protein
VPAQSVPEQSGTDRGQPAGAAVEAVDLFVPATGAEFSAGAPLVGTITALKSAAYAICMTRSGFRVPLASAADATRQYFDNSQFPDLARISSTGVLNPGLLGTASGLSPGSPTPPAGRKKAFDADDTRCQAAAQQPVRRLLDAGDRLQSPWLHVTTRIESAARVRNALRGFSLCVQQHGTPVSSAGSFDGFLAWETGFEAAARSRAASIAVDRHWARVFAGCARPTVTIEERLQSAQRAVFLRAHQAQVTAVRALAVQAVAQLKQPRGLGG